MVMYLHARSHVKPQRVKTHMQMEAGRKGHKNNKRCYLGSFCFGQELVRGETVVSLNRQGEENCWIQKGGFWSVIAFSFLVERRDNNSIRLKLFQCFLQWISSTWRWFLNLMALSWAHVIKWFKKAKQVSRLFKIKEPAQGKLWIQTC